MFYAALLSLKWLGILMMGLHIDIFFAFCNDGRLKNNDNKLSWWMLMLMLSVMFIVVVSMLVLMIVVTADEKGLFVDWDGDVDKYVSGAVILKIGDRKDVRPFPSMTNSYRRSPICSECMICISDNTFSELCHRRMFFPKTIQWLGMYGCTSRHTVDSTYSRMSTV